jgi:hypothetical protein
MDRPTKPSGRHAVRLRWDEIITRLSFRFNFLAIRDAIQKPPAKREDKTAQNWRSISICTMCATACPSPSAPDLQACGEQPAFVPTPPVNNPRPSWASARESQLFLFGLCLPRKEPDPHRGREAVAKAISCPPAMLPVRSEIQKPVKSASFMTLLSPSARALQGGGWRAQMSAF